MPNASMTSSTSCPAFRVQHDADADIATLEFSAGYGPFALALDLVIFHGGAYLESCAAWRLPSRTQPPLRLDRMASA